MIIIGPVVLFGEGEYNLNILKEIKVTDSYMGLHQNVRGCQNEEHFVDCTTRNYLQNMRSMCGCLPFAVRATDQVYVCFFIISYLNIF